MQDKIIALVKFLNNGGKDGKSYADRLLDGDIYMRSASYFVHQEYIQQSKGQGDVEEGLALGMVRCGMNRPIYCLYTVWASDCIGHHGDNAIISSRIIDEFCKGKSGYAVIIDYPQFMDRIQSAGLGGYAVLCQPVTYGRQSIADQMKLLTQSPESFLLFKSPFFSYQKEFRIISYHSLPFVNNGEYKKFGNLLDKEYGDITYSIGDIRNFARKISIDKLKQDQNGNYLLPIKNETL